MKTNLRKERGITLIALVVTIIVLLILAGVTIATVTGYNGILPNAQTSVDKYKEGAEGDQAIINEISELFKEYSAYARFLENYEQLEYIESTGTQYIDTGVRINSTSQVEIKVKSISNSGNYAIFGASNGNAYNTRRNVFALEQWSI